MSKHIIKQLSILNRNKQEQLQNELAKLQEKKNKILKQVEEHQWKIQKLHNDRGQFKKQAYQQKFRNTVVKAANINQVRFTMQEFEHRLKTKLEHQKQLNEQMKYVEQEIKAVQLQLHYHIVKDEKYQEIYRKYHEQL